MKYLLRQSRAVGCRVLPCSPRAIDDVDEIVLDRNFVSAAILHIFRPCLDHSVCSVDIGPSERCNLTPAPGTQYSNRVSPGDIRASEQRGLRSRLFQKKALP